MNRDFRSALLLTVSLALLGCQGGNPLMPLDQGRSWTYIVKAGFDTYVTPIKVGKQVSVAGASGVELTSSLGTCRLAWVGDALVADRLIGAQFSPPLPLVYSTDETHERRWKGKVTFVDRESPAQAVQSQSIDNDLNYGGRKLRCVRSVVRFKTAARNVELITWFSEGLGIVQQEQRTDDKLILRLTLLNEKS